MFNFFKPKSAPYATGKYPQPNLAALKLANAIATKHAAEVAAHAPPITPPNLQQSAGHLTQSGWHLAWATRVGLNHLEQHKPCEDAVAFKFHQISNAKSEGLALALADGISGGALGQVASQASVDHCTTHFPQQLDANHLGALQHHLNAVDATVSHAIAQHTISPGATTVACAWLQPDGHGYLAHIGDVRAYRWAHERAETHEEISQRSPIVPGRGLPSGRGHLQPLTIDQTYTKLGQLPPMGIPADNPAHMAGNGSAGAPPIQTVHIQAGEMLMLCSDGIHGFLSDAQIAHTFSQSPTNSSQMLANTAKALLNFALENGSDDDLSILLATRIIT